MLRTSAIVLAAVLVLAIGSNDAMGQTPSFKFRIVEEHEHYEQVELPKIYLKVETTQHYPCSNYILPFDLTMPSGVIEVTLGSPQVPPVCATAIGPAVTRGSIELPDGSYSLRISHAGAVDTYQVVVTPERIDVTPSNRTFTVPEVTRTYRFPLNSFAYSCSGLFFDDDVCEELARRIGTLPVTRLSVPSDGFYPYFGLASGYINPPLQVYTYPDDGVWQSAKQMLREYTLELPHVCGRLLQVRNWQNDSERSWLIRANDSSACEGVTIPTPSASPAPSPNDTPISLPKTGGPASGGHARWLVAIASAVGLAVLASTVAARLSGRR